MGWCGTFDGAPTWAHWTFSPCLLGTVSAVLLPCIAALILFIEIRKLSLLISRNYIGQSQWGCAAIIRFVCCSILALSHAVLLVVASVYYSRERTAAPYHVFYEAVLFVVWASAVVRSLVCYVTIG